MKSFPLRNKFYRTEMSGTCKFLQRDKEKLNQMKIHLSEFLFCISVLVLSCAETSMAADTLALSQSITFNETLISAQKQFQFGFFSPGNSTKSYLGIWYNIFPTQYIWVANRDKPLNDTSGVLSIGDDGNLILHDRTQRVIWSTKVQNLSSQTTVAQLLDSGNLVLRDSKDEVNFLWQSFDHPLHVLIDGMKLGWDLKNGLNRNLTSWKSPDDPSPGEYTHGIDLHGLPQLVIWRNSSIWYRSGPWNGVYFGGLPFVSSLPFKAETVINSEEVYYDYTLQNNSSLVITALSSNGELQVVQRDNRTNDWRVMFGVPPDHCANYGFCGPNAICNISAAETCSCIIGHVPKSPQEWDIRIWSDGCIRKNQSNCSERRQFLELEGMKMPDLLQFGVSLSMSVEDCRAECLRNCSCSAYANADANGEGHGCLLWFGDLSDVRTLSEYANQKLYIRVAASDLGSKSDSKNNKKKTVIIMTVISVSSVFLLSVALLLIWKKKSLKQACLTGKDDENLELPCFDIDTIAKATRNFSHMNKIGEGGFGPVYEGKLSTGQEIAVKRLSEKSSQGLDEFKNEVVLIAKLQHRNLVRLLGCCIHKKERMLIYEYMPNGSLDHYIFGGFNNPKSSHLLAWRRRFVIIVGIARGLLYLHRDSRLRIIHRDLKASNVLLDIEMNPKISDFGTARTFREEQSTTRTKKVVGTYGYMSPEYIIDGVYSMESDIFSFGVLLLEIVSGKRNSQFHHPDHNFNLLGHAWRLWLEGIAYELIDPRMEDSFPISEVLRCIQVGLLCVQQQPEDRPTMASVLLMLDSESAILPQPKHPGFFIERNFVESNSRRYTTYEMTGTIIEGR